MFFKKLKKWLIDCPPEPDFSILDLLIHKGPTLSATERVVRDGLPFHIEWKGERIRRDN